MRTPVFSAGLPPLDRCLIIRYEVQDLRVIDILPQMVALSESYFQVYEAKAVAGSLEQQKKE